MKNKLLILVLLCVCILTNSCSYYNIEVKGSISKYEKQVGFDVKARILDIRVIVKNVDLYDAVDIKLNNLGDTVFGGTYVTQEQELSGDNSIGISRVYKTTNYLNKDQLTKKLKNEYVDIIFVQKGNSTVKRINLLEFIEIN